MAPLLIVGQRVLPSARIGIALAGDPGVTRESLLIMPAPPSTMPDPTATDVAPSFSPECTTGTRPFRTGDGVARCPRPRPAHRFLSAQNLLADGRISGFEALVRWRHPKRGMVLPSEFIPLAEETGLIIDIGRLVFRRACEDLARWRGAFASALPLSISVNVSVAQLSHPTLLQEVMRAPGNRRAGRPVKAQDH